MATQKGADAICLTICSFPTQATMDRKPWNIWQQCRYEFWHCQQNAIHCIRNWSPSGETPTLHFLSRWGTKMNKFYFKPNDRWF
ncbi:hypothetical protein [Escherichia coli]|uniref:hypothetical protein n=1 Tax=Escherichia coli TaxID=562 RepID=UPI001F4C38E2|nr:hypothetical protein [Escherichia coli]UND53866.1 hypothetical protein H9200_22380 [Escherichia coli]